MKLIIEAEPKEIATLVLALQGQREDSGGNSSVICNPPLNILIRDQWGGPGGTSSGSYCGAGNYSRIGGIIQIEDFCSAVQALQNIDGTLAALRALLENGSVFQQSGIEPKEGTP